MADIGIDREETKDILDHLRDELNETVDRFLDDADYTAVDAAEAVGDIGVKIVTALIPSGSPVLGVFQLLAGPIVDGLSSLVEKAQDRRRSGEVLEKRISRAIEDRDNAAAKAARLRATPEREFAERLRLSILDNRVEQLTEKIARLEEYRDEEA